jgi:hypothetical protein
MATLAEIAAKSTSTLTAAERDKVREILEFDATPGTSPYTDLETKLDALAASGNQRARAYIDDWDDISPAPVAREGGPDGTRYTTTGHEQHVRDKLRLLLGYTKTLRRVGGIGRISVGSGCYAPWEDA